MSDSVSSAALVHLSLTEDEREALEGHRTLVLTSSQALPDCALNCSSFFLNDTLFAVARLYATDEIKSLQFPCVNSALINLDSGKPSKCHVCFYDFVLPSCLLPLFKCNELLHCGMLCFSGSGHLFVEPIAQGQGRGDLCTTVGPGGQATCGRMEPQEHMEAHQKDRFSELPFSFRKIHICHICLE